MAGMLFVNRDKQKIKIINQKRGDDPMKKFLMLLLAMSVCFCAVDAAAAPKKEKSKKAKASGSWETAAASAFAKAKAGKKPVLLLVTGSTWCGPCKSLEKNVMSSKEFNAYAKANLVLLKAEIARGWKPATPEAAEIIKKYPARGVPTVYILDENGKELAKKSGYGGQSVKAYLSQFTGLKNVDKIKEKKAKKSKKDKKSKQDKKNKKD